MFLKIGHRGAMGYEPENTLKSFQRAIDLGADMIELDVRVCKSGEVVVMHDEKINRTTDGRGHIKKKTFPKLNRYDAGEGEKIPLLSQVFDLVDRKVKINIELKDSGTAVPVAELIEDYVKNKKWQYDDFFVSSFNFIELNIFKKSCPKVKIAAILEHIFFNLDELAKKMKLTSINLYFQFINKQFVEDAHKKGIKIIAYTVDEPEDIDKMKKFGVDGIISNFPDRL